MGKSTDGAKTTGGGIVRGVVPPREVLWKATSAFEKITVVHLVIAPRGNLAACPSHPPNGYIPVRSKRIGFTVRVAAVPRTHPRRPSKACLGGTRSPTIHHTRLFVGAVQHYFEAPPAIESDY